MPDFTPNAFTINRLGLGGMFFPLSLRVTRTAAVTRAFMCTQRVTDIVDQIAENSSGHLAVFGLEQYSVFDEATDAPLTLAGLARQARGVFTVIDEATVVFPSDELKKLLAEFSHSSLTLFDLPPEWNENTVIRGVLAYREHDWSGDAPLLPEMPGSCFFIDSHDDCYLTVESAGTRLPRQIFARMLCLYAAAVLEQPDIAAVPDGLVDALWQEEFGLAILRESTEITPTGLRVGVARKPFNFAENETYPSDFQLTYSPANRDWAMEG
jgi:hypothetical protein